MTSALLPSIAAPDDSVLPTVRDDIGCLCSHAAGLDECRANHPGTELGGEEDSQADLGSGSRDPARLEDDEGGFPELNLEHMDLDILDEFALLEAEDVVVSSSRRQQRIEESPSAITVITREQIRASGYDNLVDLMRLVPGADVYRLTQGIGRVGLRSGSFNSADRMLILLDGRCVALHLFGLTLWMAAPFDVDSIERIEVIRGPGSTLYGANALQGLVNVITRSPSDSPVVFEVNAGGSGIMTTSADIRAQGRKGDWGYWASAGWDRRAPYALPEEMALELFRGRAFVDWHGVDEVSARVEAGVVLAEGDIVSPFGDAPVRYFWPYLLARLELPRSEVLAVLDSGDGTLDLDLGLVPPDDLDAPPFGVAPPLVFATRSVEVTAHHTVDLFRNSTLMVGASARAIHHMKASLVVCPDTAPVDFDPEQCDLSDVLETRLGFFLQNEWYLRDDLLLNLGCRIDHNSLTAEPGLSPRIALVHGYRPGQALRFSLGRAYRKPTFAETDFAILLEIPPETPPDLGRRVQHLFGTIGQRDLTNEYADSLELGWRARLLEERITLVADAFVTRFRHTMDVHMRNVGIVPGLGGMPTFPADASIGFENSDETLFSYGGELKIVGRPSLWLEISASYALDRIFASRTDPDTNERSWDLQKEWEPQHRLIGSARLSTGNLRLGVDAIWFSKYSTSTRNPFSSFEPPVVQEVGAATLVNGQASWRVSLPAERSLEVGVAALNLLGQPYREVGAYDVDGRSLAGGETIGTRVRLFVRGQF